MVLIILPEPSLFFRAEPLDVLLIPFTKPLLLPGTQRLPPVVVLQDFFLLLRRQPLESAVALADPLPLFFGKGVESVQVATNRFSPLRRQSPPLPVSLQQCLLLLRIQLIPVLLKISLSRPHTGRGLRFLIRREGPRTREKRSPEHTQEKPQEQDGRLLLSASWSYPFSGGGRFLSPDPVYSKRWGENRSPPLRSSSCVQEVEGFEHLLVLHDLGNPFQRWSLLAIRVDRPVRSFGPPLPARDNRPDLLAQNVPTPEECGTQDASQRPDRRTVLLSTRFSPHFSSVPRLDPVQPPVLPGE